MPIKVEAAVVTQKHPSAAFNTDSININGKVLPRETVKNGYKGSGIIGGNSYFVLTSSDVEGFADAAVTAFNNRAEIFGVSRDARSVFSGFFEDCRSALLNMSREEKELSSVCLYARGRKAVLAANYENGLFLFRNGECLSVETKPAEDTVADYSNAVLPDLTEGDIFLLLSPDAAKLLTQKDVADICKISDGSVKKIVSLISKVVLAKDGCKAVGAFAIKILETAVENDDSLGFASVFASPDKDDKAETATKNVVNEEADKNEINENTAESVEDVISSEAPADVALEENGSPDTEVVEAVETAQNEETEITNANAEFSEKIQSEQDEVEEVESCSDEVNEDGDSEAKLEVKAENEDENADETTEESENGEKPSGEKRTKLFIALFSLVALSVFLFVVIFFVRGFSGNGDTDVNATEDETTTEMSETESESESTSQDEEETVSESTTSEEISSEKTTEKREESTTKRTNNSISYNEKTTRAEQETQSVTEEVTESEPQTEEETTQSSEEISSEEETSATETEESTSEKAEETTNETSETGEETENSTREETPSENVISSEENSEEPSAESNVENSSEENV